MLHMATFVTIFPFSEKKILIKMLKQKTRRKKKQDLLEFDFFVSIFRTSLQLNSATFQWGTKIKIKI